MSSSGIETVDDRLSSVSSVSLPPSFRPTTDQGPTLSPSARPKPPPPPRASSLDSDRFETIPRSGDVSSIEDSSGCSPGDGTKASSRDVSSSSAASFPDSEEESCPTEDSGAGTSPGQGGASPPEDYHRQTVQENDEDEEEDDLRRSGLLKGQGLMRKMHEDYVTKHQPRHSYSSLTTSPKGYYGRSDQLFNVYYDN